MQTCELGKELGYKGYTTSHLTPELMDNEFMRRFNLVSKRIFETKGTIESIDMVMSMFGLSRWSKDYSIEEEYKILKPKEVATWNKDELSWDYKTGDTSDFVYKKITKTEYDIDDMVNKIQLTNQKKYDMPLYYSDDIYSGIPVREVYVGNDLVLVPYYDHKQFYDGEFTFQFSGGWGKQNDDDDFRYMETMNYMKIYGTISELLTSGELFRENEIVYIVDMTNYCVLFETEDECPPTSHYLKCLDIYSATSVNGWELVDEDSDDYERAVYIDNITNNNKANNPHVGFGEYDMGDRYWEYCRNPFKYAIDNRFLYDLTGLDTTMKEGIEAAEFDETNSKWMTTKVVHDDVDNESEYEYDSTKCKYRALNDYYPADETESVERWEREKDEPNGDTKEPTGYIMNSKMLVIKNGDNEFVQSEYYKEYFMGVILQYLLQIIPSTAILKLEGFEKA